MAKKNVENKVAEVKEVKAVVKFDVEAFADAIEKAFPEAEFNEVNTVIHFYMPDKKRNYFGMYPKSNGVRISLSADAAALIAADARFTMTIKGNEATIKCSHEDAIEVAKICMTAKKSVPKKEKKAPEKKAEKQEQAGQKKSTKANKKTKSERKDA